MQHEVGVGDQDDPVQLEGEPVRVLVRGKLVLLERGHHKAPDERRELRLALRGVATGVACDGCPALPDLLDRYEKAGGRFMVCPICFNARQLDKGILLRNAELAGTVQLWEWIGDDGATTFSY